MLWSNVTEYKVSRWHRAECICYAGVAFHSPPSLATWWQTPSETISQRGFCSFGFIVFSSNNLSLAYQQLLGFFHFDPSFVCAPGVYALSPTHAHDAPRATNFLIYQ